MRLGAIELFHLTDGRFRLDGGAMFGVVPRPLWERTDPPDARNRILLNLGVLLIVAGGKRILVDSGAGAKYDAKALDIYAIDHSPSLAQSLARAGFGPGDIDIVINTHLHFDHAGGNTIRCEDGAIVPAFPRARYFVQKGEWDWARSSNERARASYLKDDFEPLERSGCLTFIDGQEEIVPGVVSLPTPGHTQYHQSVRIESDGATAIFLGDCIPTVAHVPLPYIMGYDTEPLVTLETKRRLLQQALRGNWLLIFQHDPRITLGRLKQVNGKLTVEPVTEDAS